MKNYHPNDFGSIVLDCAAGDDSRLLSAFSASSFRRIITGTMCCGISRYRTDVDLMESPGDKPEQQPKPECRSDRLSELLRLPEYSETEEDVKKRVEDLEVLKKVVKRLQCDDGILEGAKEVRKHTKENSKTRTTLSLLGAIPPLIRMLDSDYDLDFQISALYALLNLGIGNDTNKGAIMKAGAVHRMLKLIESQHATSNVLVAEAIVANFLGLSALDSNKPIIGSSGAIPFLVEVLIDSDKTRSPQMKQDSLKALYNLSISPANILAMVEADLIPFLFSRIGDMEVTERMLSILNNVVFTTEGRKAISNVPDVFPVLVDVLSWTDSPSCQEKTTYILMVMSHKSYGDRQIMIEAGIVSSLLELTLLGTSLAQKRASRILELLRVDKGKRVQENYGNAPMSAPLYSTSLSPSDQNYQAESDDMMSSEKKAVKLLVQQSLQNNMQRIVKRANLPQNFVPSDHFKVLALSSTSKSLPF